MSEMRPLLAETADRLFTAHCTRETLAAAEAGTWPAALWRAIEEAGLAAAAVAEEKGGAGADLGDAMATLRAAGRHAAPVPLAETQLAQWMLSECGLITPKGPLTTAPVMREPLPTLERTGGEWRLAGGVRAVPWARACGAIAVLASYEGRGHVALVPTAGLAINPGRNLAGEPREAVEFASAHLAASDVAPCGDVIDLDALWRRGALARIAAMAGALEAVLEMTVRYANDRVQFGRAIARFQAVQQQIAALAANVAAACAAADAAIAAAERRPATFEIAAAKARINEAATLAAGVAHQVHGAMGFTREHRLHLATRRLWAWREEFGDESYWWSWLGRTAASVGGAGLWPFLTEGGEPDRVAL
jgi:acyl-CoA dehydrogenase